jgi:hypothetical protein
MEGPREEEYWGYAVHADTETLVTSRPVGRRWDPPRRVTVWRAGKELCQLDVHPRHPGSGRGVSELAFSPDGTRLALTVTGWVGYEADGPDELWILDVDSGTLRFLHAGKTKEWQLWDYPVQSLTPSWTADGETIVFGDGTFGIEEMNVSAGSRRRIVHGEWAGYSPRISPTSEWVAFERYGGPGGGEQVGVISRDGKRVVWSPPQDYMCERAWKPDPSGACLAWVRLEGWPTRSGAGERTQLCLWRPEPDP